MLSKILPKRGFCTVAKHPFVIIGGGCGGLSVAGPLQDLTDEQLVIVEPNDEHYYQAMWTMVGGCLDKVISETIKATKNYIPKNSKHIKSSVKTFHPEENAVTLSDGTKLEYQYLVVAPGIEIDYAKVKGLKEALDDPLSSVTTNYKLESVEKTRKLIKSMKSGTAIFTFPAAPIKCPGAPQKIMYLADDEWRKRGVRDAIKIKYISGIDKQFAVEKYANALIKICNERGLERNYSKQLIEVDHIKKIALFKDVYGSVITEKFDFLHVGPPMKTADVIRQSSIVNPQGFVDVDQHTLQHKKYQNIFSLGDASSVPTSKTAAAVAAQSGVVVDNIKELFNNGINNSVRQYNGYASCPLLVGQKKCIMAEFNAFTGEPMESFPFDQAKARYSMYFVKSLIIPYIYWEFLLRGTT
eukprot:GHVL01021798.1.p1 GENE.GHVL01021798.1~~GHVL01021798.1.p1  ORF type:complete len:412 (-),score=70.39 GHVL01021798.1:330-1565(-)